MNAQCKIVSVIIPLKLNKAYSYICSESIEIGAIVRVSFGKATYNAIVVKIEKTTDSYANLKTIEYIYPQKFNYNFMSFIKFFAEYTLTPLGLVAQTLLRYFIDLPVEDTSDNFCLSSVTQNNLTVEQQLATDKLVALCDFKKHNTILLEGVTGSGKTEIYFEAILKALQNGGQVLVLLPEISLTKQFLDRFTKKFGFKAQSWNSSLSKKRKIDIWQNCLNGKIRLIVGVRSTIFLPFKNLQLIIVDEEHDSSYKQEENIFYHTRDMAIARGNFDSIPVILSSATPSIETVVNTKNRKYEHIILNTRFNDIKMPNLNLVDLNNSLNTNKEFLSPALFTALEENLNKEQQSILFLGRRGYSPLTLCKACGYRISCPNCSVYMVQHKLYESLLCHYCGYNEKLPDICPQCEKNPAIWTSIGCGVERIFEEVQEKLPQARILILSTDIAGNIKNLRKQFKLIEEHQVDIIVGTQIISKGHNFSKVSLVGIINADLSLHNGDSRASERTYQTLMQVTGRAGRTGLKSTGIIQTYNPNHPTLKAIISGDKEQFYCQEIQQRQNANMPPFTRFAAIIISGLEDQSTKIYAKTIRQQMINYKNIEILGPAQAPIAMLANKYRYRILIKANKNINIQSYLKNILNKIHRQTSKINVQIDIDPQSFF